MSDAWLPERMHTQADAEAALRAAMSRQQELARFVAFDYPANHDYGRRVVAQTASFELLVMSWRPGDRSAIHDHGRASWGLMGTLGPAEHAVYALRDGVLAESRRETLSAGEVVRIGADLIHQLGNPGPEPLVTVHLYAAEPLDAGITAGTRLYDLASERVWSTDGPAFLVPEPGTAQPIGRVTADAALTQRFCDWVARRASV